jgi:alanine-synthesizing transaminase
VDIDPDTEAVATIGAKEGLSHLVWPPSVPGDVVLVPSPTYPIHPYSVVIAGGDLRSVPLLPGRDFFDDLLTAYRQTWPEPKMLIISFPHNPTTMCVDLRLHGQDRGVLQGARDLAGARLRLRGPDLRRLRAPSMLQVPGAKDIAVEFFSTSKSYSMAGWRLGFCVGNPEMINALTRIKSYLDYGVFQPIQIAGIIALNEDQACVTRSWTSTAAGGTP